MKPGLQQLWNRVFGERGEREASRFLKKRGVRTLTRNYRVSQGEIDLIGREGDTLIFIEVKSRKQGAPAEAVTLEKQRRLTLAALHYLKRHHLLEVRCRFDIVAIVWPDSHQPPLIEHIRDAFPAVGTGQFYR